MKKTVIFASLCVSSGFGLDFSGGSAGAPPPELSFRRGSVKDSVRVRIRGCEVAF